MSQLMNFKYLSLRQPGLEAINLSVKLKIEGNDWLFADTCPQAANRYAFFNLRLYSSIPTSEPGKFQACFTLLYLAFAACTHMLFM